MRHALVLAGGSGTRLWPMSRADRPKQLLPFLQGRSLLQLAAGRLEELVPPSRRWVCAGDAHREAVRSALPDLPEAQYLGEPEGRDTLNAVGLGAAVIAEQDPSAVIVVVTADQVIAPEETFRRVVAHGFDLVERLPETLVTFGIAPTGPATGYGYLELGESLEEGAFVVRQFREKPDFDTARSYVTAGPERFLWNSGMFVWRADTLLDCIRRYEPATYEALMAVAKTWDGPERASALARVYPALRKVSVDYAVMEPASRDPDARVAALPMALEWLDVGSWPTFACTCPRDAAGNAVAAERSVLLDTAGTLVASSDAGHLIAAVGCEDLIIIHTPDATLVCRADHAEAIKDLHRMVGERFGEELL